MKFIFLTSKTSKSISTVSGNSSLIATVALKPLEDSLHTGLRPRLGYSPHGEEMYSSQVTEAAKVKKNISRCSFDENIYV